MAASTQFSSGDGQRKRHCKLLTINFRRNGLDKEENEQIKPWSSEDVLHAVAGLCSVCLPDMEVPAIYTALTTTTTILALTSPEEALKYRHRGKMTELKKSAHLSGTANEEKAENEENCFSELFSDEDSEQEDDDLCDDVWAVSRECFLDQARQRASMDSNDPECIGPEHCVLGCLSFHKLAKGSKAVQITLLAVRKSCRRLGIGRYLMQQCKDPEAESFFQRHGFSDDPLLTARYRALVDHWENSSLMVHVPPFSTTGLAVGSLKSLVNFQETYRSWRDSAIDGYSKQLCVMERLKHELLILHSKAESQEELIGELTSKLRASQERCSSLEQEFSEYRKHTQKLLCSAAVDSAEKWLQDTKLN